MRKRKPYTVLVVEGNKFRYVDADTEIEAIDIVNEELSKKATTCIAYYWNPNWNSYSHLLEKSKENMQ
jgi:hypothetical protein